MALTDLLDEIKSATFTLWPRREDHDKLGAEQEVCRVAILIRKIQLRGQYRLVGRLRLDVVVTGPWAVVSREPPAGVLHPRHFLGVELMAHVSSGMSRRNLACESRAFLFVCADPKAWCNYAE